MRTIAMLLALSAFTCSPSLANTTGDQHSRKGNNYNTDNSYAEMDDQIHNGTGNNNWSKQIDRRNNNNDNSTNFREGANSLNPTSSSSLDNDNTNSNQLSSTSSNGNNSNTAGSQDITINDTVTNTNVRVPNVAVAPLPGAGKAGVIGDIAVPLPTISIGGFASGGDYNADFRALNGGHTRQNYGVTLGFHVPLGTGDFQEYAVAEAKRRADRANFILIKEALVLKDAGVLDKDAHTAHWIALYGE